MRVLYRHRQPVRRLPGNQMSAKRSQVGLPTIQPGRHPFLDNSVAVPRQRAVTLDFRRGKAAAVQTFSVVINGFCTYIVSAVPRAFRFVRAGSDIELRRRGDTDTTSGVRRRRRRRELAESSRCKQATVIIFLRRDFVKR
jgi:hypothetical protein